MNPADEAVCMEILKQSEAALDTLEREYLEAVKKLPQEVSIFSIPLHHHWQM